MSKIADLFANLKSNQEKVLEFCKTGDISSAGLLVAENNAICDEINAEYERIYSITQKIKGIASQFSELNEETKI